MAAEDPQPLPNLPQEIIDDILLRLPVKTLLRFRCVCQSWCSLISQPKFAKTHLSSASSNSDCTHHRLLHRSNNTRGAFSSWSVFSIMHEENNNPVDVGYPFGECRCGVLIEGSFNGLVCVSIQKKTLCLWNPSMRKSMKLPDIELPWVEYVREWYRVFGFGYDESIDDYKVVLIFHRRIDEQCQVDEEWQNKAVVYRLRTDSWRTIGDCPHTLHKTGSGKFVSGSLHWMGSVESKEIIVSLDLAKETYGEVSQPDYDVQSFNLTMDVLGGYLCMLCTYNVGGADLWVMKEYGIRESWTKLVAINDKIHSFYGQHFTPKYILKNGTILMDVRGRLVRYNPKDGKFSYPKMENSVFADQRFMSLSVYPYIESLVSPC